MNKKQNRNRSKKWVMFACALMFSGVSVAAVATSQADQNAIAKACRVPLEKFMHNQMLTTADEQALSLCAENNSCTNSLLATLPGGCSLNLSIWHSQYEIAKQNKVADTAKSSTATNTQSKQTEKAAVTTTAPAVSEFHSTNDATPAPVATDNNANAAAPAPQSAPPAATPSTPAAAPAQENKQKQSINWF